MQQSHSAINDMFSGDDDPSQLFGSIQKAASYVSTSGWFKSLQEKILPNDFDESQYRNDHHYDDPDDIWGPIAKLPSESKPFQS